jgi:RNA polymerase sigma-70 factor (ECF subfamily)
VRRYLAGDRGAGDELARKFTPLVRAIVRRVLRSQPENWDDACQAVFLRLFERLDRWDATGPFCKWLAVVAARRAIDARDPPPMPPLPPETPDRPTGLPDWLIARLERVLADLPPEWRRAYDLDIQGATREEIARASGVAVRTVYYWLDEVQERLLSCGSEWIS